MRHAAELWIALTAFGACLLPLCAEDRRGSPYAVEVWLGAAQLQDPSPILRAKAVERFSMMRERSVARGITGLLEDSDARVRREAAMYLAINGDRSMIEPLLTRLMDADWTVRRAAILALRTATTRELPYASNAAHSVREAQARAIRTQLEELDPQEWTNELLARAMEEKADWFERCDALRALARFAEPDPLLVRQLVALVEPHEAQPAHLPRKAALKIVHEDAAPNDRMRPTRQFVEAAIRAIGRLSTPGGPGEDFLIRLLEQPHWAAPAMDAMLDCGGSRSVDAVIAKLPAYGFDPAKRQTDTYRGVVQSFPASDTPHLSSTDRLPKLHYHALRVLCQLPLEDRHRAALRAVSPTLLATIPSHFDATVVYQREPHHQMTAYLLEFAGVRQHALDAAWSALGQPRSLPADFEHKAIFEKLAADFLAERTTMHPPYASQILAALVPEEKDIPLLIDLLDHEQGWVRIDACRALIFLRARQAAPRLRKLLKETPDDASHGVSMDLDRFQMEAHTAKGFDEFNDPSPRFKYAWIVALGELGDERDIPLLTRLVDNPGNVLEVQTAAARALAAKSSEPVLAQMQLWATRHTNHAVRMVAREALRRAGKGHTLPAPAEPWQKPEPLPPLQDETLVFIKGPHDTGHHFEISKDQTAYSTTDSGPTYRFGHNLHLLHLAQNGTPRVEQLTHFQDAFVADCEVDYDGEWIVFAKRNREGPDPWWHLFEIRRDGTGLRQITHGPYHDVHPVCLPDGSIAFSSTRLGYRDEYHGYPATGLTTVRRDGSDIRVIGSNFGRDAEPAVDRNGRILFTRLELFYSRVKTEWTLMSAFPDGTRTETLYGPERRELFAGIGGASALSPARHRLLRITQPQPFGNNQYIINSFRGPMLVGPGRMKERFLRPDNSWAVTCPYPLDEHTLLVAAGKRTSNDLMATVNHGLHRMDVATGDLTLIYDDPDTADFEARPLRPRLREPILASPAADRASTSPTGVMMCNSVFESRQPHIARRARYIRVNEGIPVVERHNTHTNGGSAWRNHGGPIARILGTLPLADDGSFSIELPADRLVHFQALDSDRQVIGNEINWQYARPGERVSCIGCHEKPDTAPVSPSYPEAFTTEPVPLMPTDDDILYRAKMWTKGWADDEREARMRSVNSINTYGRE